MPPSLVLLSTSHRVAPGLLTWDAWRALREAARVCAADEEHPLAAPLADAGVTLTPLRADDPEALAVLLLAEAGDAGTVVWCLAGDGEPALVRAIAERVAADPAAAPELELLPGSYDVPGARFLDLVTVMDRLRSPGGCPWDREQTHASLVRYLLEEAYEVAEAVETGDRGALREELGDVLMQVTFHARIAAEHGDDPWDVDDVAGDIVAKLVSRHPHVFGDDEAPEGEEMQVRWDALKAAEKGRTSATDGVPLAQPALALAGKLLGRAERAGVDVTVPAPLPLPADLTANAAAVGELLFSVVAAARRHGVDPEQALRATARAYRDRVRTAETGPPSTPD